MAGRLGDLREAVTGELAKAGQGNLVAQDEGKVNIAGQPCTQSRNAQVETCVWSGAAAWGFVTDTSASVDRMDAPIDSILLSVNPVGGEGYRLTTESITVGTRIDGSVFKVSSNIAFKPSS
ncbi:MAG: hypothetical protein M3Y93_12350 [Pseudomonadota bacterium]|nr:hypothetical protein [Pseudomonadota bacterium]